MPALLPTHFTGTVTWLGRVIDSEETLRAEGLNAAELTFAGIEGECHGGLTRPSCVRTKAQYPKGTEIRNVRQLSVLSAEELALIASEMGLEAMDPAWMGASMVIEGIPDFSHVPPSSRLQVPSGASITIDMENRPCIYPGREIEKDRPGFGPAFKPAAKNRRGVTAWVEREGSIAVGDTVTLHIPDQPVWAHFGDVRT
ncbi:MOSC domain-containing protein [uncultured Roseobacter sp.]|uniref:MOSC domain-containing protein n=1 Tax=uncultured Roseobacter sp. TaxID=114847 RepID=UPI002614177A|nr:MOSC domain-containing protein [uncultured Roseobacter sp.]